MRELIQLNQNEIEAALADYFAKKQEWHRASATLKISGATADGKGLVSAEIERGYEDCDPY